MNYSSSHLFCFTDVINWHLANEMLLTFANISYTDSDHVIQSLFLNK